MEKRKMGMQEAIKEMNRLGAAKEPFLFIIDFDKKEPVVEKLPLTAKDIFFKIGDIQNDVIVPDLPEELEFEVVKSDKAKYEEAFDYVQTYLKSGKIALINLTQPTEVRSNCSLQQLFHLARAPYKLYYKNRFLVFSPETFVKIEEGILRTFPMKGTIDATLPDAQNLLLNSKKEQEEHQNMIEILESDLKQFSPKVWVERRRYFDLIQTHKGPIWETSSEIRALLPEDFNKKIGEILFSMLPGGSILGLPRAESLRIIKEVEGYERGYYTGVFGYFDGEKMDSSVMIRFLENKDGKLIYKSGGGVTGRSDKEKEYRELIQKVYVPVD